MNQMTRTINKQLSVALSACVEVVEETKQEEFVEELADSISKTLEETGVPTAVALVALQGLVLRKVQTVYAQAEAMDVSQTARPN